MRAKFGLLLAGLMAGALAAPAVQTIPCAAVAPEVRERVRADGACRDAIERPQRAAESKVVPAPAPTAKTARRASKQPKSTRPPATLPVPSVVGGTIESAEAQLHGFQVERVDRPSPAPAGEVIEQSPDASASASAGSRVSLVVSSGPPMVQVPNVVDRSYDDATNALSAFTTVRIGVASAAPAGQVLAQQPASGSIVTPGSRVALQVSDGTLAAAAAAAPVAVPAPPAVRAANDRPLALHGITVLAVVASLLLGSALGALAMRHWLMRRLRPPGIAPAVVEPTATVPNENPPAEPASAVRFFARLDAGEIVVEFPRLADDEEPVREFASDR
jgi:hypothetical protein